MMTLRLPGALGVLLLCLLSIVGTAAAVPTLDFTINAPNPGSIAYGVSGAELVGSGITIASKRSLEITAGVYHAAWRRPHRAL